MNTTVKSKLTPNSIPFEYLIPPAIFKRIKSASPNESAQLTQRWSRIAQLEISILEAKLSGIEPAPHHVWIDVFSRKGKKLVIVRSSHSPIFNGCYQMTLGEADSVEHQEWSERVALASNIKQLEKLRSGVRGNNAA